MTTEEGGPPAMRYSSAEIDDMIGAEEDSPGTDLAPPTGAAIDRPGETPVAPTASGVVDVAMLRELDDLKAMKKYHAGQATELEQQIHALEQEALEMLALAECDRGPAGGRRMAHISRQYRVSRAEGVEQADFIAAYVEAGGDWAVLVQPTINNNTLRSHIREVEDNGGEAAVPEAIRAVTKIGRVPQIGFTGPRPTG